MGTMRKVKRDDVIEAVLEIILEDGPDKVGAIAVARKLGTAPQIPYKFFTGREEMLDAALQAIQQSVVGSLLSAERHAKTPLEALRIFINQGAELMPFISVIPRLLISSQGGGDSLSALARRVGEREAEMERHIRRILTEAQADGQVRHDIAPHEMSRAFLGCALQMYNHWARSNGQVNVKAEVEAVWEQFHTKVAT